MFIIVEVCSFLILGGSGAGQDNAKFRCFRTTKKEGKTKFFSVLLPAQTMPEKIIVPKPSSINRRGKREKCLFTKTPDLKIVNDR